MPTEITANHTAAATSTDTGANSDCEPPPEMAGRNEGLHHDTRTNGIIQDLSETESTLQDGGCTNTIPESDDSRPSPSLTPSSPDTPVPQAESCTESNNVEQPDKTQASSGSTATGSSRLADKRKRVKHTPVQSSSDEALSEHGLVLKFGLNTEETLQRKQYRSLINNER